jgi:colicin import membrane protein
MKVRSRSEKISFACALGLHLILAMLIIFSVERTIILPAEPSDEKKQIIDAVMVNKKTLQEEVNRLEEKELKKRQVEQERIAEIANKEKEAIQKREKEEKLIIELKKKNEELKKEAELQKLAQEKLEKEREAKLKKEQEELKKIQKAKEEALAQKKKLEEVKKAQEEKKAEEDRIAAQKQKEKELTEQKVAQAISPRVKMDQITKHAMLIRNKIHQHWRQPIGFDFNGFYCVVTVSLLPTGDVVDAVVIKSSGNVEFDRSAEVAVRKASPLPMPEDSNIAKEFRQFDFTFRPEAV